MSDLDEALRAVDERLSLTAKAERADELELRLLADRAGFQDVPAVNKFLAAYEGERTAEALHIAWSVETGDDSFLTTKERLLRELTKETRP